MPRSLKKLIIQTIKKAHIRLTYRDFLLLPPSYPAIAPPDPLDAKTIGKNDDKSVEKPEKKEKKIKDMTESRVKKFQKLFGQQVSVDEKLINYFSCALVAEILLQGHLYVSENFFSFYSNVFGYVTKLVIPISTVTSISKEKTAKFFPNAIALQLTDGKHVFGSFISREAAYQLMSSIHRRNETSVEPAEVSVEEEVEPDEVDAVQVQDAELSSISGGDSSSISGSETFTPTPTVVVAGATVEEAPLPVMTKTTPHETVPLTVTRSDTTARDGGFKVKLMSEFNLLFLGIGLTVLLAFFSALLLMRINALEEHQQPGANLLHDFDSSKFTIEDAESILNKNVLIVRNVRKKLEDLQELLQNSFDKIPSALSDKQEF